jgi:hypothetical protein
MNTIVAHLQKYYGVYLLVIAVVFMLLWLQNRTANRYAICQGDGSGVWILDTRTGQLYFKGPGATINFGTIDKNVIERVNETTMRRKPTLVPVESPPEGFELETPPPIKDANQ